MRYEPANQSFCLSNNTHTPSQNIVILKILNVGKKKYSKAPSYTVKVSFENRVAQKPCSWVSVVCNGV